MKKQLLMIEGGFASFWSAVSIIRQNLEMLTVNLVTAINGKVSNFLTPVSTDLVRKDNSSLPEEIHMFLTPNMDWIGEDTSQGGEFLNDALRIKEQPLF